MWTGRACFFAPAGRGNARQPRRYASRDQLTWADRLPIPNYGLQFTEASPSRMGS